jgi:hypothetical protein
MAYFSILPQICLGVALNNLYSTTRRNYNKGSSYNDCTNTEKDVKKLSLKEKLSLLNGKYEYTAEINKQPISKTVLRAKSILENDYFWGIPIFEVNLPKEI